VIAGTRARLEREETAYRQATQRLRDAQRAYRERLGGSVQRRVAADYLQLPSRVDGATMVDLAGVGRVALPDLDRDGAVTMLDYPVYELPEWDLPPSLTER
jgi:hypothetical protein